MAKKIAWKADRLQVEPPSLCAPDQQMHQIASIFAAGVLRLRKLHMLVGHPADAMYETSAESAAQRLDV